MLKPRSAHCLHHVRSAKSVWRRTRRTRCAPGCRRALDQRPDPPVRQVVRDLLLRARHGGQVAYHLLAQAGAARAPWPVTTIVSCLPVLVLAMGTALAHMLRADAGTAADAPDHGTGGPAVSRSPAWSAEDQAEVAQDQAAPKAPLAGSGPPHGPGRPRSRTTTPGRQQQSRPASARHAWPPAGLQQRESRYPDGPCAARESGAPTRP